MLRAHGPSKGMVTTALVTMMLFATAAARAQNILTNHNDNARTGQNLNETTLTPANVNPCDFRKLFSVGVDDLIYAQPLYAQGITVNGPKGQALHDVVFVATEGDRVYALDAVTGAALWKRDLLVPPELPATGTDVNCSDIAGNIGVTGTPVIDLGIGALYVVAKLKIPVGPIYQFKHRIHALNLSDGTDRVDLGSPREITTGSITVPGDCSQTGCGNHDVCTGSCPNNTVSFDAKMQHQRAGLLIQGGMLYVAFGGHCDNLPYHGWIMGFKAKSLQSQAAVWNTSANGCSGGIWQGGGGPAGDGSNVYFLTGNAPLDGLSTFGDSFVRLGGGLGFLNYWAPPNACFLDDTDMDLGSGGAVLLPPEVGSRQHPNLVVGAGKWNEIHLLDRDGLGFVQTVTLNGVVPPWQFGLPVYFNYHLYFFGIGDHGRSHQINAATIDPVPTAQTAFTVGSPGLTPVVSANGAANGIVWVIDTAAWHNPGPAVLRAFDAGTLAELYNSSMAGNRDTAGNAVKFTVPTVANGQVYIGTAGELDVYGLMPCSQ